MKICECCGEPIGDDARVCPYCEQPLTWASTALAPQRPEERELLREVNLESGLPTVEDAMRRFNSALDAAIRDRVKVLRVIHGKGTSTGSALIRDEIRRTLAYLQERGKVRGFVFGEDLRPTRQWRRQYPFLEPWERQDRENAGITLVEL